MVDTHPPLLARTISKPDHQRPAAEWTELPKNCLEPRPGTTVYPAAVMDKDHECARPEDTRYLVDGLAPTNAFYGIQRERNAAAVAGDAATI